MYILVENKLTMKVTGEPVTIQDKNLSDFNFKVPLYQREYSWELEQVSDLFYDIENSGVNNEHFLGSILLHAKDENTREIIDGQQRLTTIFLILYSIRTALKKVDDKADRRIENGIKIIDNILFREVKKLLLLMKVMNHV